MTANAQDAAPRRITTFEGDCQFQLVEGFFPCGEKVAFMELTNGRSFLTFFPKFDENLSFSVSGGSDRQPNLENYYLAIDTVRMLRGGEVEGEDKGMEGECHFKLNDDASEFFFIKCDVYNRQKGSVYNFHLENIKSFKKVDF